MDKTNDKLPEEIQQKLTSEANAYATSKVGDIQTIPAYKINEWEKAADGWEAGATAWAPWKVKYDESNMRKADELAELQLKLLDTFEKNEVLKRALQEFVSNHEAGLLPNRFVYEKAIKILNDGTTERNPR